MKWVQSRIGFLVLSLAAGGCGDDTRPLPVDSTVPLDSGVDSTVAPEDTGAPDVGCGDACAPPSCVDGLINGDETDIDCGGADCDPCLDGADCAVAGDCDSGVCTGGMCAAPACGDGVVQGDELCDDGSGNSDSEVDACRTDCTPPACGDGVADSTEACDDGPTTPMGFRTHAAPIAPARAVATAPPTAPRAATTPGRAQPVTRIARQCRAGMEPRT